MKKGCLIPLVFFVVIIFGIYYRYRQVKTGTTKKQDVIRVSESDTAIADNRYPYLLNNPYDRGTSGSDKWNADSISYKVKWLENKYPNLKKNPYPKDHPHHHDWMDDSIIYKRSN